MLQYDLTQTTVAAIEASKQVIYTEFGETSDVRAIRMGPDGRMYVSLSWSPFLGVIDSPNTLGTGCNFNPMGVDVSNGGLILATTALGLPNNYKFSGNSCPTPELLASFTPSQRRFAREIVLP